MHILMLTQFYFPHVGGEERLVQDLSVELAARGHQVAVVALWQEGLAPVEEDHGVRVYRIRGLVHHANWLFTEATRRHAPPLPDPGLTMALRRIIQREQPEVVHAHNWLIHSFLPLKRWSGAKLALSLHDYSLVCATKKLLYSDHYGCPCTGPGLRKCLRCSANHYGTGKGVATAVANGGMGVVERNAVDIFLPVSQATALHNGLLDGTLPFEILPNFLSSSASSAQIDIEPFVRQLPRQDFLLFVGAFGAYKGIDVLLEAYAGLPRDTPPLVLIGYQTAEYPVRTVELPSNVILVKNWPHEAVMAAWQRSMIALVPSLAAETFGIVALEAMAEGRPVIASRIGALPEVVIDGETGLLVPPGDPSALQQAIVRLLASTDLRARFGRAGQERAQHYSAAMVVPQFEATYRRLVGQPKDALPKSPVPGMQRDEDRR